jgi:hypothetical protein
MAYGMARFSWYFPASGFSWVQGWILPDKSKNRPEKTKKHRKDDEPEPVLVPGPRPRQGLKLGFGQDLLKWYEPFQTETALFRTFAATEPTEEGILAFANRYGRLSGSTYVCCEPADPDWPEPRLWGEPISQWRRHIARMKQAVEFWDLARQGDTAGLSRYIWWEKSPDGANHCFCWEGEGEEKHRIEIGLLNFLSRLEQVQPGGLIIPTYFLLNEIINPELTNAVAPQLSYAPHQGREELSLCPQSLLGALWLQFAQAIAGNRDYRACRECGKWFEVSLEGARKSRLFCTDACKSKSYRGRKERAQALRATGKGFKEIARELETDVATVKKWVSNRKG